MLKIIHRIGALVAPLCIALFWTATIVIELWGSPAQVARLKALIVTPGLWILIPAIAMAGASGMLMSKKRGGRLVEVKKKRMPFVAANGLLVLLPCAIALNHWAAAGQFDARFYAVQVVELIAGPINFILMALNVRDGLRLAGRLGGARRPNARTS